MIELTDLIFLWGKLENVKYGDFNYTNENQSQQGFCVYHLFWT